MSDYYILETICLPNSPAIALDGNRELLAKRKALPRDTVVTYKTTRPPTKKHRLGDIHCIAHPLISEAFATVIRDLDLPGVQCVQASLP